MSVDISPSPDELIGEMERDGFSWAKALAEMIDNAFDENASRVVIRAHGKSVCVEDDGNGCPSPESMLRKGYSTKRGRRDRLGRYGVGLKHASFYVCGQSGDTQIVTVHGGTLRLAQANWGQMIRSGRWVIDDPIAIPATREACAAADLSGASGTLIKFTNARRALPTGKNLQAILDSLAFEFCPAIDGGGKQIVVEAGSRHVLRPPDKPEWIESIERVIHVGKKRAKIHAGIVSPDKPNRRRGLSYYFLHRIIVPNSGHGCAGYPIAPISGTVELDDQWRLGQNKSSVSDDDWPALGAAVLDVMRPMLEKASQQASYLASDRLRTDLEAIINQQIGRARRPNRGAVTGTTSPRGTGRKVKEATLIAGTGEVKGQRERTGGRIDIEFINSDGEPLCSVDITSNRVTLNQHFPFVRDAQEHDNEEALAAVVIMAFVQASVAAGATKVLPSMPAVEAEDRFSEAVTRLLGQMTFSAADASSEAA